MSKPFALGLVCCSLVFFLLGCGEGRPNRVPVAGQVLIDGKPLTTGSIMFVPQDARPSSAQLDGEGRFQLTCYDGQDGAVLGKHQVLVMAAESLPGDKVRWHAPAKYSDHLTSGLEVEVTESTDDLKIDLSWDGGQPYVE